MSVRRYMGSQKPETRSFSCETHRELQNGPKALGPSCSECGPRISSQYHPGACWNHGRSRPTLDPLNQNLILTRSPGKPCAHEKHTHIHTRTHIDTPYHRTICGHLNFSSKEITGLVASIRGVASQVVGYFCGRCFVLF